ncbi:hypothetical protein SH139x_003812 [Planctomycetaceae bacterium SH139]
MNRFGLRLTAGLVVICLGGLAIYQTRSNDSPEFAGDWSRMDGTADDDSLTANGPAPLPALSDFPLPPDINDDQHVVRGNDPLSTGVPNQNHNPGNYSSGNFDSGNYDSGVRLATLQTPVDPDPASEPPANLPPILPPTLPSTGATAEEQPQTGFESPGLSQLDSPSIPALSSPSVTPGESPGAPQYGEPTLPPSGDYSIDSLSLPALDDGPQSDAPLDLPPLPTYDAAAANATSTSTGPGSEDSSPGTNTLRLRSAAEPPAAATANSANTYAAPATGYDAPANPPADQAVDAIDAAAAEWGTPVAQPAAAAANQPPSYNPPAAYDPSAADSQPPAVNQPPAYRTADLRPLEAGSRSAQPSLNGSNPAASLAPTSRSSASDAAALQVVSAEEVLAVPGTRETEGLQSPHILVQKSSPSEVRVGRPTDFTVQVRNVGEATALDVRVFDKVPTGTTFVETVPPASRAAGMLIWQLGDLRPGEERTIITKLIPDSEGEIGSVARVTFEAAASVRTIATQPNLQLTQNVPTQVLIGQQLEIDIALKNSGSGSANGVVLLADLPDGLEHVQGRQIELPIGELPPGSQQNRIMRLRATKPGVIQNTIVLTDSDGVQTKHTAEIEVISPAVEVSLAGPSLRYLERQATYDVEIANMGTADASNVEIMAFLDKGLKFVSTEAAGQYDPERHAVFWSLEELPAGRNGSVPLTVLPVQAGQQAIRLEANADLGIVAASSKELTIETLAELSFTIADDQDPIEVGAETLYKIRVTNNGTRDDTNVRLEVRLPHPALQLVGADPLAQTDGKGLLVFDPIASLPAKGEQVFQVRVRGTTADAHLIKATLVSDQSKRPVTKEESTTVYADQ